MAFEHPYEADSIRAACDSFGVTLPAVAAEADAKAQAAAEFAETLATQPEPVDDFDALIEFRQRQPEKIKAAQDIAHDAEWARLAAYQQPRAARLARLRWRVDHRPGGGGHRAAIASVSG